MEYRNDMNFYPKKWHFCETCQRGWKCETIKYYGECDMPMFEKCYECKNQTIFKQTSFSIDPIMIPHIYRLYKEEEIMK